MIFFEVLSDNILSGLIFWLVCIISLVFAFIYQRSKSNRTNSISIQIIWICIIVIAPSLFIGFRAYDLNYDTQNYVVGFLNVQYKSSISESIEDIVNGSPLFYILRYIIFNLSSGNPTAFLFFISFVSLFILVWGLDKWKDKLSLPMALFIYYAFFGMQLLNQSRQMLALSIFLLSIHFLLDRKYIKYFIVIIIASLIHFTALIGMILPLLNFKKTRLYPLKGWIYNSFLIISPLLLYPIFKLLPFILPASYDYYLTVADFNGIGMGLILNIGPVLLPLLIYHRYFKEKDAAFLERVAFLSYPLRLSGYFSYFMMRMYYFGAITSVLLFPLLFRKLENKRARQRFALIIIFIYSIYYIVNYLYVDQAGIFPYRSIFSQK
ncbi:EpsG family protein [Paenibacillus sp. 2RAB27]|uniref:EpsG family protein n=1 Tax=Paenibacillus sp. 2RAB27 TaxID=3232991 RepID=UPI003F9E3EF2